jgi:hypothetical protein
MGFIAEVQAFCAGARLIQKLSALALTIERGEGDQFGKHDKKLQEVPVQIQDPRPFPRGIGIPIVKLLNTDIRSSLGVPGCIWKGGQRTFVIHHLDLQSAFFLHQKLSCSG